MYKATFNGSGEYLVHFNKNHSSKNGQFTSGDGDGDGIADDHRNQKEKKFYKSIGSKTTGEYYDKAVKAEEQGNIRKKNKYLKEMSKSSKKDEKEALRLGDEKRAKQIKSGRLFIKSLGDSGYLNKTVNDAFRQATKSMNFDPARGFNYEIKRNEKQGGIDMTINNMMGDKKTFFIDYE